MIVTDWKQYEPYFTPLEMACKHTGKCEMQEHFMDALLMIRLEYGKPLHVTSGYRDHTHPAEAGKAHPGEHTFGCAADVAVGGADAMRLLQVALNRGITRVGVKQDNKGTEYLHLGMGAHGLPSPALWSY